MTNLITDTELLRISSRDSIEAVDDGLAIYSGDLSEQTAFRYSRWRQRWRGIKCDGKYWRRWWRFGQ